MKSRLLKVFFRSCGILGFRPDKSLFLLILLGATICTPQLTWSAFIYNEAIDGDISISLSSPVFNFDLGINSVSGSSLHSSTLGTDFDNFQFVIPTDMILTSISYSFSNVDNTPNTLSQRTNFYLDGSGPETVDVIYSLSPVSLFDSLLPVGEGTHTWDHNFSATWSGGIGGGSSWDYTLDFDVTAVPIPGALLFLGSGLIGIAGIRRKFRKS